MALFLAQSRGSSHLFGTFETIGIKSKAKDCPAEMVGDCLSVFQLQSRFQQQTEQLRQELETAHKKSSHQLNSRLTELEASCRELTEKKYKNESAIRDLKIKLVGADEVSECLG